MACTARASAALEEAGSIAGQHDAWHQGQLLHKESGVGSESSPTLQDLQLCLSAPRGSLSHPWQRTEYG